MKSTHRTKRGFSDSQVSQDHPKEFVTGEFLGASEGKAGQKSSTGFLELQKSDIYKYSCQDEISELRKMKNEGGEHPDMTKPNVETKEDIYTDESESDDSCGDGDYDTDLDSKPSVENMEFSDDEGEIKIDQFNFYEHNNSVTKKSWTVARPSTKRLSVLPFLVPSDGQKILAHVDTDAKILTTPVFKCRLASFTITNLSKNLITYFAMCSDTQKLHMKDSSVGFVNPEESRELIVLLDSELSSALNEKVSLYAAPFKIVGHEEVNYLDHSDKIGLKHFEDLWQAFGTMWFPQAEAYSVKLGLNLSPEEKQGQGGNILKMIPRQVFRMCSFIFNWGPIKPSDCLIAEHKSSKFANSFDEKGENLTSIRKDVDQLKMKMKKMQQKLDQDIWHWKLWKLIFCLMTAGALMYNMNHVLPSPLIFLIQFKPEEPKTYWSEIFSGWNWPSWF